MAAPIPVASCAAFIILKVAGVEYVHASTNIFAKSTYHQPYLSSLKVQEQYVSNNYKIIGDSCNLSECKFSSFCKSTSYENIERNVCKGPFPFNKRPLVSEYLYEPFSSPKFPATEKKLSKSNSIWTASFQFFKFY
jgi:hypothetical protein